MLFVKDVKADYSTPGLKWKVTKKGSIKGCIYTAFPKTLKTRFGPSAILALIVAILTSPVGAIETAWVAFVQYTLFFWVIGVIWPYWPLSRSFKLEGGGFTLGGKRYRLTDMSDFQTQRKSFMPGKFDEVLIFGYGRKIVKIKVPNKFEHTLRIAETLNRMKQDRLALEEEIDEAAHRATSRESNKLSETKRAAGF